MTKGKSTARKLTDSVDIAAKRACALENLEKAWGSGSGLYAFRRAGYLLRCDRCPVRRGGKCRLAVKGGDCQVLPALQSAWWAALVSGDDEPDPCRELLVSEFLQFKSLLWLLGVWLSTAEPFWKVGREIQTQPVLSHDYATWSRHALAILKQLDEYDRRTAGKKKVDHARLLSAEVEIEGGKQ